MNDEGGKSKVASGKCAWLSIRRPPYSALAAKIHGTKLMNMKNIIPFITAGLVAACFVGCANMSTSTKSLDTITHASFGNTPDGTPVEIYTDRKSVV
jgi:hypothetical protein